MLLIYSLNIIIFFVVLRHFNETFLLFNFFFLLYCRPYSFTIGNISCRWTEQLLVTLMSILIFTN